MNEYKENTVGWWLSQLKEPLRSMCIGYFKHDAKDTINMFADTIHVAMEICYIHGSGSARFILGAKDYLIAPDCFDYTANAKGREYKQGWDMAEKCAPDNWLKPKDGGEDKAIVDSPEKPKNWIDQELWKWHTDVAKGGVEFADAERAKAKLEPDSPAPIDFEWNDNAVIDFTNWNLKRIKLYEDRFEIENQDILDSFKRGDAPELWHQPEYPLGYTPPAPDHPLWNRCEAMGTISDDSNILVKHPTPDGDYWWIIKQIFGHSGDTIVIIDRKKGVISSRWPDDDTLADNLLQRFEKIFTESKAREIEPLDSITIKPFMKLEEINAMMNANPHINFYDSFGVLVRKSLVEPAVIGYEIPLPIDTIEKKHELRIKNLEARVKELEGVVGKLEQQIEYVYRNLPKDFDGTR